MNATPPTAGNIDNIAEKIKPGLCSAANRQATGYLIIVGGKNGELPPSGLTGRQKESGVGFLI